MNNTYVWYKVTTESGITGWISAVAVRVDSSKVVFESDSAEQTLTITEACNVRSEPNADSRKLTMVKAGRRYGIMDTHTSGGSTWYKIEYTYQSYGWVSGKMVEVN